MLCAGCMTTPKPQVVIKLKPVERHLPPALKRACASVWSKPGGPAVTADWIERGDVNETRLRKCSAQMKKVIEWDAGS